MGLKNFRSRYTSDSKRILPNYLPKKIYIKLKIESIEISTMGLIKMFWDLYIQKCYGIYKFSPKVHSWFEMGTTKILKLN